MFVAFLNGTLGTMMATTIGGWREIDGSEQANPDKVESASFNSAPSHPASPPSTRCYSPANLNPASRDAACP